MTKYEQAIKYFEEQLKVLDDHCKRGGDFASEALEHTKTAIEALKKQVPRALTTYQLAIKNRHMSNVQQSCNRQSKLQLSFMRTAYSVRRIDVHSNWLC